MEAINVGKVTIGNEEQQIGKMQIPVIRGEDGINGKDGIDGVSISKVEQISESTESQGINQIEVSLSNGTSSIFNVRNGKQGEPGKDGANGKDAKEYDDTELRQLIEDNLKESKEYTDTEIANFDFVKIVDELPKIGLPNRVYFVPKTESESSNIFDEYAWINETWEYFGTKTVEVDLTDINASISALEKNKADKTEISDGILVNSVIGYDSEDEEIPEGYEEVEYDGEIETIINDKGRAVKFPDRYNDMYDR